MAEVGEQAESGPAVALNGDGASKMPKREGGRRKIKRLGGSEAGKQESLEKGDRKKSEDKDLEKRTYQSALVTHPLKLNSAFSPYSLPASKLGLSAMNYHRR
jgi:hypothetical protein